MGCCDCFCRLGLQLLQPCSEISASLDQHLCFKAEAPTLKSKLHVPELSSYNIPAKVRELSLESGAVSNAAYALAVLCGKMQARVHSFFGFGGSEPRRVHVIYFGCKVRPSLIGYIWSTKSHSIYCMGTWTLSRGNIAGLFRSGLGLRRNFTSLISVQGFRGLGFRVRGLGFRV